MHYVRENHRYMYVGEVDYIPQIMSPIYMYYCYIRTNFTIPFVRGFEKTGHFALECFCQYSPRQPIRKGVQKKFYYIIINFDPWPSF